MSSTQRWGLMLVLLPLVVGCTSTRVVRLDTGQGPPWEHTPSGGNASVEVEEDDFEKALARLVLEMPLPLRPAEAVGRVRALAYGSTLDKALRSALRKDYGRWCQAHEAPGDCLSLLEEGFGFNERNRLALALGLSMEPMHESIADAVEDTLNPTFFKAVVVSALVSWAVLAANPEPVFTKAAAAIAVLMVAYLGVDAFLAVVEACGELKRAADRATTFQELEEAGARFGRRVGTNGARVFTLAVALVVGTGAVGGASGLGARLPLLPGISQAAALSASQLGVRLMAIEQVGAVAVVDGGLALSLAPGAMAMVAMGSGDIQGDPDGNVHHICTDKNKVSDANGGPWTPEYQALFERAGMSLNDPANKVRIRGHEGPHPEAYHELVFERVRRAMGGCRSIAQCREALVGELRRLAEDLSTPGSYLRQLVTRDKL